MANPNPDQSGLAPFTGADDPRRANGPPKGTIHLSTHIQNMLDDPDFDAAFVDEKGNKLEFKGHPVKAIIKTAVIKAQRGDKQWADWLANNGYGQKLIHEVNDSRKEILDKYLGDNNAGEAKEAPSRSSEDTA